MDEQQPGCAKCAALRVETEDEYQHRLMDAREFCNNRLLAIYLEHERGEHDDDARAMPVPALILVGREIEKARENLGERLREWCTRDDHVEDTS